MKILSEQSEWIKNPKIYEINTLPWLRSLSDICNASITLGNIPERILNQEIKHFDAVWLMGVWERSPASKRIASEHPDLLREYHKALDDFREEDVIGSPYAVYYYHINKDIGGVEGLIKIRNQLKDKGIQLILDYVPNHVSIDSLWTFEPDLFVHGTLEDLISQPNEYFSLGDNVFAHGKDPMMQAPWSDTIQINAFSEDARQKTIHTLLNIAELCDGVRCDMAMLMTSRIFSKTWSKKAGSPPNKDFWEEIIPAVKSKYPNFLFIAEVYWDMELELQQQGFDFCYDKKLYEKLFREDANSIRDHLKADWAYQSKLIRFIENHDELRAIEKFGKEKSKAAALITLTLPGGYLIYEGQNKGHRIKLPVQLGRNPLEETDKDISSYYQNLMKNIPGRDYGNGSWSLCETKSVDPNDPSYSNIISYLWWINDSYRLIVVNYSPSFSKAHIKISPFHFDTYKWTFTDLLYQKSYSYTGDNLYKHGLYVELDAWKGHIFNIRKESN
ncbi:MAG: alpha-amylase [Candidatus Lokiarchaeota archaeon]|nr:alpha-amylase [Candidatus Lokiarchaeota archaeon]